MPKSPPVIEELLAKELEKEEEKAERRRKRKREAREETRRLWDEMKDRVYRREIRIHDDKEARGKERRASRQSDYEKQKRAQIKEYKKNPALLEADMRKGLYFSFISLAVAGGYI